MSDYQITTVQPGQRLAILQALKAQTDGKLNENDITNWLDTYGYRLTRDDVRERLRDLEKLDAVRVTFAGGVIMVAEITRRGEDHLERRGAPLVGVARPPRD